MQEKEKLHLFLAIFYAFYTCYSIYLVTRCVVNLRSAEFLQDLELIDQMPT